MRIEFSTANAAFNDDDGDFDYEVGRILKELGQDIENGLRPKKIVDINGNSVGTVEY